MTLFFLGGCFIVFTIVMVAAHALRPDDELAKWRRERERLNHRIRGGA